MAMIEHGTTFPYKMQVDRSVTEQNDGALSGTVNYEGLAENIALFPRIGDPHPDNTFLELYQREVTYTGLKGLKMTASYAGVNGDTAAKGEKTISFTGGQNQDPIETHPKFKDMAGTGAEPKNGAIWVTDDFGNFFFQGFGPGSTWQGVEYYLTPATIIEITYWSSLKPNLEKRMKIKNSIPGVTLPPDVKDVMLVDTPYREVGSFYQITEQYIGSGPKGWDTVIYGDAPAF